MAVTAVLATEEPVSKPIPDAERMEWWMDARFGMFVHWGIFTIPAGFYKGEPTIWSAEWIMEKGRIPIAEYETYADRFNPTDFDAEALVVLAKRAGMKYLVITAKHHDGFSMFDSKCNSYNVVDATPFKRDVMKELAEACATHGIRFGFYYSQAQDWHHPGGLGNDWDTELERVSSDEYVYEKALPEVEQLLTEYGPISIFWWDTPREMSKEVIGRLHTITTELQPAIITNDRLGAGYPGHHKTFERGGPRRKPSARYWELCQPISRSWGYRSDDHDFKPIPTLIRTLIDSASKGGNYLLNVSPTHEGVLKPESLERLDAIAGWMDRNSVSIYGTTASPCEEIPKWGRITSKQPHEGFRLYLHIFEWNDGDEIVVPVNNDVESCHLLVDQDRALVTKSEEDGIHVKLTGKAPDAVASVIVLNLSEAPKALPQPPLEQDAGGRVSLPAYRAEFENLQEQGAAYNEMRDCVDQWDSEHSRIYWDFTINEPGTYQLLLNARCRESAELTLTLAGQTKTVRLSPTGGEEKEFESVVCAPFIVGQPGEHELSLMPKKGAWNPIFMKDVTLNPIVE